MGSQGFHDFKRGLGALPRYRGSHLYAYDTAADVFEEVSRSLPGGVVTRHTGIIALAAVPGRNLLAGLEHPSSNIVLFDTRGNRVQSIVRGIPWQEGNPLSREIAATKQGRIYTYRGSEEPRHRARRHAIWVHDLATGANRPTTHSATGGFWNGQSGTRDGERIFLSTVNGELYRLDTAKRPGHPSRTLPAESRGRCRSAHRPALRHHLVGRRDQDLRRTTPATVDGVDPPCLRHRQRRRHAGRPSRARDLHGQPRTQFAGQPVFRPLRQRQGHRGPGRPRDPEAVTVSQART